MTNPEATKIIRRVLIGIISLALFLVFTANTPFSFSAYFWNQIERAKSTIEQPAGPRMARHPVYGRILARNQESTIRSLSYQFTFRTDEFGRRVTPRAARDAERIAFLGSSWTFGVGVADPEVFPYKVGEVLGERFGVENHGHLSWALIDSFKKLHELLDGAGSPLKFVIVDWLPNYHRDFSRPSRESSAIFVPENLAPNTRNREARAAEEDMIRLMSMMCKSRGVKFKILLLSKNANNWRTPEGSYIRMKRFLQASGIEFIDLVDIHEDANPYLHDPHPGPGWHKEAARRISLAISDIRS